MKIRTFNLYNTRGLFLTALWSCTWEQVGRHRDFRYNVLAFCSSSMSHCRPCSQKHKWTISEPSSMCKHCVCCIVDCLWVFNHLNWFDARIACAFQSSIFLNLKSWPGIFGILIFYRSFHRGLSAFASVQNFYEHLVRFVSSTCGMQEVSGPSELSV